MLGRPDDRNGQTMRGQKRQRHQGLFGFLESYRLVADGVRRGNWIMHTKWPTDVSCEVSFYFIPAYNTMMLTV